MYEGEDVNTIDLLHEAPTSEGNGVKIIIPVKWTDVRDFKRKITEQLAYFQNVYFNVEGVPNTFTIIRHQYFQFSEIASDKDLHICLDDVYYPLDFSKLGIDKIYIPVGLRFSLSDGIFPTPNRESIRYTQEAKELIINRLKQAADYFVEKYNENVTETVDIKTALEYYRARERNIKIGMSTWDIHPFAKFSSIPIKEPVIKGVSILTAKRLFEIEDYILGEYEVKYVVNNKNIRNNRTYGLGNLKRAMEKKIYIYSTRQISGIKKDYIKTLVGNGKWGRSDEHLIVKKYRTFELHSPGTEYNCYSRILKLYSYPKHQWRQIITEFQHVINSLTAQFIDLDTLEVPQDFIDSRKKVKPTITTSDAAGKRVIKLKGEIICKQATELERWVDGKSCKWVSQKYDLAKLHTNPFILVYGRQDQEPIMDKWYKYTKVHKIRFASFSERELKIIQSVDIHNVMSIDKFLTGENPIFKRVVTYVKIWEFKDKGCSSMLDSYSYIRNIDTVLYKKLETVDQYYINVRNNSLRRDDMESILKIADATGKFDTPIYNLLNYLKQLNEKLPFINHFMGTGNFRQREFQKYFADLFKYHRHRINWQCYKQPNLITQNN